MPVLWFVLLALPILGGAERFSCRGRILGAYYADAKSGCKAFHVCVRVAGGGVRDFRFFCPPGTLFHQEAQTCTDWGDDDPLACPADIYDGFDTKKVSSRGNQEEESEFRLQNAETGDRRLHQNNVASNSASHDLRTAHSSDFFSGQRERGRDDYNTPQYAPSPRPKSPSRQSFRRVTTYRSPATTQYTTPSPSSIQPSSPPQYDAPPKRKLVRKRPIYASTLAPTTYTQSTAQQQSFSSPQPLFNQQPQQSLPQQNQNFNHRTHPQSKPSTTTVSPPANVPPEYKDEYVEVARVAPKKNKNRYIPSKATSAPFPPSTSVQNIKPKDGLVELYNFDAQSTPGFNALKESQPFKVRNSFSVTEGFREQDFVRTNANANNGRITTTTVDYNTAASRGFATSTPAYRNFNSVSYHEPEKKNFVAFSGNKQNYFNNPTTTPITTIYTTSRPNAHSKLNTVAYNTNIALNTVQPFNFGNAEDDGQYRLPEGEDDGQYRPELYERELLSGAHSLNIAASGNRLPSDQKNGHDKSQSFLKPGVSQSAAPRPFRPAPTPSSASPQTTTYATDPTYTTTYRAPTTLNTQRSFDFFQTYTTTSRPSSEQTTTQGPIFASSSTPVSLPEQRTYYRAPSPPTASSVKKPVAPVRPPARQDVNKEDSSYDYAYYDSDTGLSEYDHVIEEFEKTKGSSRA
ncbi:flocculation protein FLO11-like isoform X2 [Hyposmocoma kahamanoa]|uniref:flocculation protein FLO11-like isoform X2 n=1 Tax=Hyposmocoma kahamanoa TaxID=1477025 RepID=UPI000E6D9495|nr:flocculation protein FLO11-like isoform X2 [Hyposmocoma kahamanoa]